MYGQVVCDGRRRREEAGGGGGGREAADWMQNQKQEPHTKMWGKKTLPVLQWSSRRIYIYMYMYLKHVFWVVFIVETCVRYNF